MSNSIWLSILILLVIQAFDVVTPLFFDAMTSALATIPFSGAPMTTGLIGAKLAMGTQLLRNLGLYGRPKRSSAKSKMVNPSAGIPKAGKPASGISSPDLPIGSDFKSTTGSALGDTDLTQIFQALRNQGFDPTTALQMIESGAFDNLPQGIEGFGNMPQGGKEFGNLPQGGKEFGNLPQGGKEFGNLPQGGKGFSDLPQGIGGFGGLPQDVGGFGNLPQDVGGFANLPQGVGGFGNLPEDVGGFGNLPQGVGGFGNLPQGVGGFGNLPQGVGGFGNLPQGVGGFGNLPQGVEGFEGLPQGGGEIGDLPQDVGEFGDLPQGVEGEDFTNLSQDHPVPSSNKSPEEETEEIFAFVKQVDDDGCMSRLVCSIGKDPTIIGPFSDSIHNLLKSAKRGSSSVVDEYMDVMETGSKEGGCMERYPECGDDDYDVVVKTVSSSDILEQND